MKITSLAEHASSLAGWYRLEQRRAMNYNFHTKEKTFKLMFKVKNKLQRKRKVAVLGFNVS